MLTVNGLFFDGKADAFPDYAKEVELRNRVTNLDPVKRASASELRVDPVAREVRDDQLLDPDSVAENSQAPHD